MFEVIERPAACNRQTSAALNMRSLRARASIRELALMILTDKQAYTSTPACSYGFDWSSARAATRRADKSTALPGRPISTQGPHRFESSLLRVKAMCAHARWHSMR